MTLDFTQAAKEFELNNDFTDSPESGGGKGNGQQRRVNLIRMAMEHGAKLAYADAAQIIRKTRIETHNQRIISNGHQDSGIFEQK